MRIGWVMGIAFVWMTSGCVPTGQLAHALDIRIGIVDVQRILQESAPARKARQTFLEEREEKRSVLMKKRNEVLRMQQEVRENPSLSEGERQEEAERIKQERKDLGRLASDLEEELKKKDLELTREVLEEIRAVIERFRKTEEYTVIFEKKAVVSYDQAVDITEEILRLYNASAP
ncbi:MAG: OmpH family outer membrane protein [Deltaproteobacteria bacterium]|nr:OmpH family outer membrane protein [Deltaproteobacteria bacterium]